MSRHHSSTSSSTTSTALGPPEIIRGAAAAAQAEGLTVAFTALSEGDERRIWFDHITSRGTRGIILLLSQLTDRQKGELVARGLPFVVIDPTAEPGPEVSSVGCYQLVRWVSGNQTPNRPRAPPDRDSYGASRTSLQPGSLRWLPGRPREGRPIGG